MHDHTRWRVPDSGAGPVHRRCATCTGAAAAHAGAHHQRPTAPVCCGRRVLAGATRHGEREREAAPPVLGLGSCLRERERGEEMKTGT
jgi:hypothetical protein